MRLPFLVALLAALAAGQQPNSSLATLTVDGVLGPPHPIAASVRTGVTATIALSGVPGAPILLAASATGTVQAGALATGGGLLDLPAFPPPVILLDGTSNPAFTLDGTGSFAFGVLVPPAGVPPAGIPLGHQEALQAALADPSSPAGFTLAAATQVTVIQGPIVVDLSLGDDGAALIDTGAQGFSVPFFGATYTQVWICVNGFLTFGMPDTDYTPTPLEFNTGYPRLAPFWTDLAQSAGEIVRYTIDPSPAGGQAPFIQADWIGIHDWGGIGGAHTFSAFVDATGSCRFSHAITTAPSVFNMLCGIGPGNGLNPQPAKDLSALQLAGGAVGAVNESFYEVFGPAVFGGPPPTNPFDLFGATLHFLPAGPGSFPASTSAYAFY